MPDKYTQIQQKCLKDMVKESFHTPTEGHGGMEAIELSRAQQIAHKVFSEFDKLIEENEELKFELGQAKISLEYKARHLASREKALEVRDAKEQPSDALKKIEELAFTNVGAKSHEDADLALVQIHAIAKEATS